MAIGDIDPDMQEQVYVHIIDCMITLLLVCMNGSVEKPLICA